MARFDGAFQGIQLRCSVSRLVSGIVLRICTVGAAMVQGFQCRDLYRRGVINGNDTDVDRLCHTQTRVVAKIRVGVVTNKHLVETLVEWHMAQG